LAPPVVPPVLFSPACSTLGLHTPYYFGPVLSGALGCGPGVLVLARFRLLHKQFICPALLGRCIGFEQGCTGMRGSCWQHCCHALAHWCADVAAPVGCCPEPGCIRWPAACAPRCCCCCTCAGLVLCGGRKRGGRRLSAASMHSTYARRGSHVRGRVLVTNRPPLQLHHCMAAGHLAACKVQVRPDLYSRVYSYWLRLRPPIFCVHAPCGSVYCHWCWLVRTVTHRLASGEETGFP
jgi:hypothetical protein